MVSCWIGWTWRIVRMRLTMISDQLLYYVVPIVYLLGPDEV